MLTIRRLMVRGAPAIVRVVLMPFGDDNDDTQGDWDGDDDVHDIVEDVQLLTQIMMNRGDDGNIVAWTIVPMMITRTILAMCMTKVRAARARLMASVIRLVCDWRR